VKPITGGSHRPCRVPVRDNAHSAENQRIGLQPEGLSACFHPKKIPKTLQEVQVAASQVRADKLAKSQLKGQIWATVGDHGKPCRRAF